MTDCQENSNAEIAIVHLRSSQTRNSVLAPAVGASQPCVSGRGATRGTTRHTISAEQRYVAPPNHRTAGAFSSPARTPPIGGPSRLASRSVPWSSEFALGIARSEPPAGLGSHLLRGTMGM